MKGPGKDMRCDELIQEIATPNGRLTRSDMAQHLADCPSCAKWSDSATRLDQVWAATRPLEPSNEAFDSLWSSLSTVSPVPAHPVRLEFRNRRPLWVSVGLAQAAAVLILALAFSRMNRVEPTQDDPAPAPVSTQLLATAVDPLDIPVDGDATLFIRFKDQGVGIDRIDMDSQTPSPLFVSNRDISKYNDTDALNHLESMAD